MRCYESLPWGPPLSRTRALPDADFAGFPIDDGLLSSSSWGLAAKVGNLSYELTEQDTSSMASVILVTEGAQWLGEAVCKRMATRGWAVAVADINAARAAAVAASCMRTAARHFRWRWISPPQTARLIETVRACARPREVA